nr:MAG TPA: hypothetical protein [Bacteriophage sp.]
MKSCQTSISAETTCLRAVGRMHVAVDGTSQGV